MCRDRGACIAANLCKVGQRSTVRTAESGSLISGRAGVYGSTEERSRERYTILSITIGGGTGKFSRRRWRGAAGKICGGGRSGCSSRFLCIPHARGCVDTIRPGSLPVNSPGLRGFPCGMTFFTGYAGLARRKNWMEMSAEKISRERLQ